MSLETEGTQQGQILVLLNAAAADGDSAIFDVSGYASGFVLESEKTGTGTATLTLNGSFDKVTWYAVGYAPMDGQTTLTRAVAAITIAATNPLNHTYLVQDRYPYLKATLASTSGVYALTAKLFVIPV